MKIKIKHLKASIILKLMCLLWGICDTFVIHFGKEFWDFGQELELWSQVCFFLIGPYDILPFK